MGRTAVHLEPFVDADDLDRDDQIALTQAWTDAWDDWLPGDRLPEPAALADLLRFRHPPRVHHRALARDDAGRVVGWGEAEWRVGEPGAGSASAWVPRRHRGSGVGGALIRAAVEHCRAGGRTGVLLQPGVGSPADERCRAAGLRADLVAEVRHARVDAAPEDLLRAWVAAGEAVPGYSLVRFDDRCPADLEEQTVAVRHVMNDAPTAEGEADHRFTVAELRHIEDAFVRCGRGWWMTAVRDDASGELVGFTELLFERRRPWIAFQGDTGVRADHRGRGLGAWIKAANHLRLRSERPEVEEVQTMNASHNRPMLRINAALGFAERCAFRAWLLPFD